MDESKQRAIRFLEKEIRTYQALALFLLKMGIKADVRVEDQKVPLNPSFYRERIKEAKKLVSELKKSH